MLRSSHHRAKGWEVAPDDLRAWLNANNATVLAVLMLVIGMVLLGNGLGGR